MDISTLLNMTPDKSGNEKNLSATKPGDRATAQRFEDTLRTKLAADADGKQTRPDAATRSLTPLAMISGSGLPGGASLWATTGTLTDTGAKTLPGETVEEGLVDTELPAQSNIADGLALLQSTLPAAVATHAATDPAAQGVARSAGAEAAGLATTIAAATASVTRTNSPATDAAAGHGVPADEELIPQTSATLAQRSNISDSSVATSSAASITSNTTAAPITATAEAAMFSGAAASPDAATSAASALAATSPSSPTAVTSPAQPQPALSLQAATGSTAWGEEFGQQLVSMAHRGDKQVDLHLHPRELGSLSVSLSLDDQGARAQFVSANANVRSAIEQALPQLREALAQQGIALGETSVGDQRQPSSGQQSGSGTTLPSSISDELEAVTEAAAPASATGIQLQRGVDLYA